MAKLLGAVAPGVGEGTGWGATRRLRPDVDILLKAGMPGSVEGRRESDVVVPRRRGLARREKFFGYGPLLFIITYVLCS